VKVASGLEKDVLYLLDFAPDAASPIVDEAGRPLRPQRLTRLFKFVEDGGVLKLAPSL
jgi:hypothetical protein